MENNLRELTHEQHKKAEKSKFINRLLKGNISTEEYYVYLSNQFLMYSELEDAADNLGIFDDIKEIKRTISLSKDLQELEGLYNYIMPEPLPSTKRYIEHIRSISNDKRKLLSHIYVRHMGDLSGGQIIKRFVPGSGNHYMFDGNVSEIKIKLKSMLDDDMADEAIICFDLIRDFLEELEASFGTME